jgi:hypothetical protein
MHTSRISLDHPSDYGTRNAVRILQTLYEKIPLRQIQFIVAVGTDAYRKWGDNIAEILMDERKQYPDVPFRILLRDSWTDPLEKENYGNLSTLVYLMKDHYSLPIRSTHARNGELRLVPSAVRRFIDERDFYKTKDASSVVRTKDVRKSIRKSLALKKAGSFQKP